MSFRKEYLDSSERVDYAALANTSGFDFDKKLDAEIASLFNEVFAIFNIT